MQPIHTAGCHTVPEIGEMTTSTINFSPVKGKGNCLESRLHDNACSTDFTFPLARQAPMQPATIHPTLDLCTRYPLRLDGPRQCGIRSLPDTSTHGQQWESNPRPSDLESNALSIRPYAPLHMLPVHYLIFPVTITLKVLNFWKFVFKWSGWIFDCYCSLKPFMLGHGGSSASSYLADPTSPIPSHCAVMILFKSVPVHQLSRLAL